MRTVEILRAIWRELARRVELNFARPVRIWIQMRQLRRAQIFDDNWYNEQYPDVLEGPMDPLYHYVKHGGREGRNPSRMFDGDWYRARNPEVADGKVNPLLHYLKYGGFHGKDPHPLFDSDWYLWNNPDAVANKINPLMHYVRVGARNRRDPHPLFRTAFYLSGQDAILSSDACKNPLVDYLMHGASKSRNPHPLFDTSWYLARNPDVAFSGQNALAHYIKYGAREGRDPHPLFDSDWYSSHYLPATDADHNPLMHYVLTGGPQGLPPHPYFNVEWYCNQAPPLLVNEDALSHFVTVGLRERRSPHPSIAPDSLPPVIEPLSIEPFNYLEKRLAMIASRRLRSPAELPGLLSPVEPEGISSELRNEAQRILLANAPQVSVIMPTWNRAHSVIAALESVVVQSYRAREIILINDGSTDNTVPLVLKRYSDLIADGRLIVLDHPHVGVSAARNAGIRVANGDFLAFLDSDNTWHPDHLLLALSTMIAKGGTSAYTAMWKNIIHIKARNAFQKAFSREELLNSNIIDLNVFVHHRSLSDRSGLFDESMTRLVDWDYIIRLTAGTNPVRVPVVTVEYVHDPSRFQHISEIENFDLNRNVIKKKNGVGRQQ